MLEAAGVAVFALSGALVAARKGMDPFGFILLATVTGVGGGTLRDLLLGHLGLATNEARGHRDRVGLAELNDDLFGHLFALTLLRRLFELLGDVLLQSI